MNIGNAVLELLRQQGVPLVTRGPNVKKGEVNMRCPFCGAADPSHHLGINPNNGYWACWRNSDHRGKSPVRLLVAALGEPVWKIRQMLGLRVAPDLSEFHKLGERIIKGKPEEDIEPRADAIDTTELKLRGFSQFTHAAARFDAYLLGRGLPAPAWDLYGLMYAVSGPFKDRVVLPYYYRSRLVTLTGRSIHKDAGLRYRDLEPELSVLDTSETLYNYDRAARGGRLLLVVEGPIDSLKGDFAGTPLGVHVVGLSTNSITDDQIAHLIDLSAAFDHTMVCMDTPTRLGLLDSHKMVGRLRGAIDCSVLDASRLGKDLGGASVRSLCSLFKETLDALQ